MHDALAPLVVEPETRAGAVAAGLHDDGDAIGDVRLVIGEPSAEPVGLVGAEGDAGLQTARVAFFGNKPT
ncbi:hypothetical protein [Chenggangzhangella methanolivorans]|uniref:Uncharacterized protein n=1 Tax=Chenggangzhangella methanolivorans TaxID=1437009 RepID=A0A9E6RCU7_9HYPH|nr:hypothetical protein [Chenggangzhangella methanolivorans]QZO00898.1 hypothetical protein K6K41_04515 [Chenggangzhangella methanolivorans]